MSNYRPFIPKDPRIPDFYTISIWYHGETESIDHKVVWHDIIDKCYHTTKNNDGTISKQLVGVSNSSYFEMITHEDEIVGVPISSIRRWKLHKDYARFKEAAKKISEEQNQQKVKKNGKNSKS